MNRKRDTERLERRRCQDWTWRRPFGQLPHHRRSIRTRSQLSHDLFDLAFRLVHGASEQRIPVLRRKHRCQLCDAAQMEPAVGEHLDEDWMFPSGLRDRDPQLRLAFGHVQDVRAVREDRGSREPGIEMAGIHLADVADERGLDAPGPVQQFFEAREDLVVGE
jgi:hypothetical protein